MCRKIIIFLLFIFYLHGITYSQDGFFDTKADHWSKRKTFLMGVIGCQPSAYSELGLARIKYMNGEMIGLYLYNSYHASVEWIPTYLPQKPNNIFSLKTGYSGAISILAYGIDVKYQTDFVHSTVVATPKIGFGLLFLEIYYGYNISINGYPFDRVKGHQLSMVFNYNHKLYKIYLRNNNPHF